MTAMTTKSTAAPRAGAPTCTPCSRTSPRVPISQPAAAVTQNSVSVVRRTGTPSCRAAFRAPPLAKTALPNRVRQRAQVATAVSASHHSSDTRNRPSPSCSVDANTASAVAHPGLPSSPVTRADPVTASTPACGVPCRTRYVARVTRKLGSPVFTTRNPLTRPTSTATARDASRATQVFQPARSISKAVTSDVATAVTPIDRSNWPAMSSRATATPPMPSRAAGSRTLARPPEVRSCGAWIPKNTTTTTRPSSAGRLGRASARPISRRPRGSSAGDAPSVGRRSLITGTAARWGCRTSAAGPPRRTRCGPVSLTRTPGAGPATSRFEQPPHPVVGVPRPAGDRAGVGDAVAHDPGGIRRGLQGPAAGLPGGPERLQHHGHADGVDRAPVGADVDPGDLAVGHLDVVVMGLQTEPAAQRPAPVAGRLDPAVVQQDAPVVVPDQAQLAALTGADADVAGQAERVLVAGRLPGDRNGGGTLGLEQHGEDGGERRHRAADGDGLGVPGRCDVLRPGCPARFQTAEIQTHRRHADTLPPDPAGNRRPACSTRRPRTRCRL